MSLNELLLNQYKPWLNIEINNLAIDGYPISISSGIGLTGGSNPQNSQNNHQYQLSGFTAGNTISLGDPIPNGQILSFTIQNSIIGNCVITASPFKITGTLIGNTGNRVFNNSTFFLINNTVSIGDYFELRSANQNWYLHGIIGTASSYL